MGAALGLHARNDEIRELYEGSALLPLIGADKRDQVIANARIKKADDRAPMRPSEANVLLIIDGTVDLFYRGAKAHTLSVSKSGVNARVSSLQNAARRARYDVNGPDSQWDEDHNAVAAEEILIYWRGHEDLVCRYACQTGGEEVVLKSAIGDRVELRSRTRYLQIPIRHLVGKGGSAQSINAITNADLVELLGGIPFFSGIPRDKLIVLTEVATIRVYPPQSIIFREDEGISTQMFVTLAGTLEVSSSRAAAPLARLEPGSFFGEMSLLINIPRAATVMTTDNCLLMSIEKEAFHTFLDKLPEVRSDVYKLLKERLIFKAMLSGVLPFFRSVSQQRLIQFSHDLTIEDQVKKSECLLDQERPRDVAKFGVVVYGVLEIVSGEQRRVGIRDHSIFLTPGCYFGPFTFERLNFQKGKIYAKSSAVVLTCPFEKLQQLFQEYPEVAAEANIAWFGERCDLAAVLRHAVLTQRFQAFLEAEHSDENFVFCLDVQKFRSTARDERFGLANYILTRYIQPDSPKEVNLPASIRDQLINNLKKCSPVDDVPTTFFDAANDEIMRLMTKDSFPRFKKSPMFQSVLDALDPHFNRKGSKLLDACHAFREAINHIKPGKVENVAVAKLQRMLSTIRRSHERHTATIRSNASRRESGRVHLDQT